MDKNTPERKYIQSIIKIAPETIAEKLRVRSTAAQDELDNIISGKCEDNEDELLKAAITLLDNIDIQKTGITGVICQTGIRYYRFGNEDDEALFYIKGTREQGKAKATPCYKAGDIYVEVTTVNEAIICGAAV